MDLRTQLSLCMHCIHTNNPSFNQGRREERFECTDLILLLCNIAVSEHRSRGHIIATEQMHWMGLCVGRAKGFAINGQLRMLTMALARLKSAGFGSTALLYFPANKECRK